MTNWFLQGTSSVTSTERPRNEGEFLKFSMSLAKVKELMTHRTVKEEESNMRHVFLESMCSSHITGKSTNDLKQRLIENWTLDRLRDTMNRRRNGESGAKTPRLRASRTGIA